MFHNTLLKEIQNIMKTIEVKFTRNAKRNETLEIKKESDIYVSAALGRDSFVTYPQFDVEAIEAAGVLDLELIKLYRQNKNNIPYELRAKIIEKQRGIVIRNYIEKNNYYRTLNGQPDFGDTDYIYVDLDISEKYNVDPTTPIHLLPEEKLNTLNTVGYIDKIKKIYPDKKYLGYLGYNRIDIVNARIANNFAIIRIDSTTHEALYREFITLYEQSREYFMSVIYITEYSSQYDLYDNFIGLCIMLMTIQRLVVTMFKATIEHDFIDWGSIQMVFRAYNIPFIENLPMEYQRILLKNINILLRRKSTDRVLFDVCSLLGYERLKIFKYFLMKKHKLDANENPLFFYKNVTNEFGERSVVEDKEKMYELYFQKVSIDERNLSLALTDSKNRVSYDEVVINDPYWWEDEGVKEKILEEEFTYVETKYLSINMIHKMTEMIFELMYAFRMIIDKKEEIEDIYVEIPRIVYNGKFKLFNLVAFLCALMCKRAGFKGNIITTHSKILGVYGFDFKEDFDKIKEIVYANKKYIDPEILKYLENLTIIKPEDVNRVFEVIKEFNDYIVQKMYESKDIKQYHIYKHIFQTLMVSEASKEMFKKNDGTEANTFLEYLEDQDYVLYEVVKNTEVEFIPMLIEHVLVKLNELMYSLKYLYILNDTSNPVFDAIVALLTFFKSYTVDITSLNIVYLFDSKYYNAIKLIGDLNTFLVEMDMDDEIKIRYADQLRRIGIEIRQDETLVLKEFFDFFSNIVLPPDVLLLRDEINRLSKNLRHDELLSLKEKIEMSVRIEYIISILMMRERLYLKANIRFDEDLKFSEKIDLSAIFNIMDGLKQQYSDSIHHIDVLMDKINEKLKMDEHVNMNLMFQIISIFELLDKIRMEKELELNSVYDRLEDKIKEVLVKMMIQSVYEKLEDTIYLITQILEKEKLTLEEIYYIENTMKMIDLLKGRYSDNIKQIMSDLKIEEENILKEHFEGLKVEIPLTSILDLEDTVSLSQISEYCSTLLTDFREDIHIHTAISLQDKKELEDSIKVIGKIIEKDKITYEDFLNIKYNLSAIDKINLQYSDKINFVSKINNEYLFKLKDFVNTIIKLPVISILEFTDKYSIGENLLLISKNLVNMKNELNKIVTRIEYKDNDLLSLDTLSYMVKNHIKDKAQINDKASLINYVKALDTMALKLEIEEIKKDLGVKSVIELNDRLNVIQNNIQKDILTLTESVNIEKLLSMMERINSLFSDNVSLEKIYNVSDNELKFMANALIMIKHMLYSTIELNDEIKGIVSNISLDKFFSMWDDTSLEKESFTEDKITITNDNLLDIDIKSYGKSKLSFHNSISNANKNMSIQDIINNLFSDISILKNKISEKESFIYKDTINIIYEP